MTEHSNRIEQLKLSVDKKKIILRLKGQGDMLLEEWALGYNSRLFEKVFKRKVVIE